MGKISGTGAVLFLRRLSVYMSKIRSAVPKVCGHRAEILECRAQSARVNGV